MPEEIKVMLCETGTPELIPALEASGKWIFENKYDGEYGQIHVASDGSVRIINRQHRDITKNWPEIAAIKGLPTDSIFVGEIWCPDNQDAHDKPTTAGRTHLTRAAEISLRSKASPAYFMCFDVIRHLSVDLTQEQLGKRKHCLEQVYGKPPFYLVAWEPKGSELWKRIEDKNDEGIVAKRLDSIYEDRRSRDWLKIKTWQEGDFRVIGWTSEKREISALLLDGAAEGIPPYKVNFAVSDVEYNRLLPLIKANPQRFMVKVKYANKSATGLRFPVMREIYEVKM